MTQATEQHHLPTWSTVMLRMGNQRFRGGVSLAMNGFTQENGWREGSREEGREGRDRAARTDKGE